MITLSIYDSGLSLEDCLKKFEFEYTKMKEKYSKMERELNGLRNDYERIRFEEQNIKHDNERLQNIVQALQKDRDSEALRSKFNETKRSESPRRSEKDYLAKYQE